MADWIIVVDDDLSNLQAAGTILSRNNMRVTALDSGQALLDYVRDNSAPDLILLDINMPEMDGFETLKKYRSLEEELNITKVPVIFLTGNDAHIVIILLFKDPYEFIRNIACDLNGRTLNECPVICKYLITV